MKKYYYLIWLSLILFIVNSCNLDNLDFEKLSGEVNLKPEFVFPVAKANVTVWDLVQSANKENEDLITKDPNGLIKIIYRQNDLFTYNVRELLKFPASQSFSSGEKYIGDLFPEDVQVSRPLSLRELIGASNGQLDGFLAFNGMTMPFPAISMTSIDARFGMDEISDFTSITLSKGNLEIKMENKLQVPLTITGNLFDVGNNKVIADFTFSNIPPNGTKTNLVNLTGKQFSNKIQFRLLSFVTPGSATPVKINLDDFFKLDFSFKDLGITQGNVIVKNNQTLEGSSSTFFFDFPEPDMKSYGAVLKKGTLLIKTTNSSKLSGSISFTLSEVKKNGVPIQMTIPLSGTSTTIDLSGAVFNFASDPITPYNRIPYEYSVTVNKTSGYVNYSTKDAFTMDITLSGLEFKSITGDFGKRSITVDPDVFDMNVDMFNRIDGGFKLANPKLELIIRNSIGMPASVDMDFTASNKDGATASLNPPIFEIPVPANINSGIATKSVVFDRNNSNIVNFIALPPSSQISYNGKVDFNQKNVVSPQNPNFLDVDAIFAIDMAMELPLELQISNLSFKDTSAIEAGDYDQIESADLILNAKNGVPLDIEMQLLFVDTISGTQYGASKSSKILSAATVNATGQITPVQSSHTFSLSKTEMDNLRKANGLVISGKISSTDPTKTVSPIMSDSKIEMNVVIKSKINL
jgi:hypothetical protein